MQAGTWDLVECTQCGHIYVHPLPQYSEIASLYPNTYYTVNKKSPLHWMELSTRRNSAPTRASFADLSRDLTFGQLSMLGRGGEPARQAERSVR
jgi:hypothetical protein